MNRHYQTLFTLQINHEYYDGVCPDISFFLPTTSKKKVSKYNLLIKQNQNILHCLYEANDDLTPKKMIEDETLLIALKLDNPYFSHITDHPPTPPLTHLYRNQANISLLSKTADIELCSKWFSAPLNFSDRPNTVTLQLESGETLFSQVLTETMPNNDISIDLDKIPLNQGLFVISEQTDGELSQQHYFYEPELLAQRVFALIELSLNEASFQSEQHYHIDFSSRAEIMRYYIVATNYSDADFNSLSINDTGFTEDGRSEITFNRIDENAFNAAHIPAELLKTGEDKLAVFESTQVQKRHSIPRRHIQLNLNGDVLIPNLPSISPESNTSTFFIPLVKP